MTHPSSRSAKSATPVRAWQVFLGLALFSSGIVLAHVRESTVHVDAVELPGAIPALHFRPKAAGPHPIALLTHGVTASKETLFRMGEALAAAGFDCFAVDFPGHGESRQRFVPEETTNTVDEVRRALGHVDVFLGHSMGAYAGAESVRAGRMTPRLFIAVGALPNLGERGPPLLLLAGRFDEAVPADLVEKTAAERGAKLVLSWSDHALEPYDPTLVNAAVGAACDAMGKAVPAPPTYWKWRLFGAVLAFLGAPLVLGRAALERFPALGRARGPACAGIAICTVILVGGTWLGASPSARHIPAQIVAVLLTAFVVVGARRLRIPRWALGASAALAMVFCAIVGASFLALLAGLLTMVLLAGSIVASWVMCSGSSKGATGASDDSSGAATIRQTAMELQQAGDFAFAIFVGYAVGQWMPALF